MARMDWWREARFGLFIHWGLYAIPAGEWKGNTDHAEWIRHTARIPLEEYDKFVNQFNPTKFNAEEWVKLAKLAGMKYLVITSKHHDGFCLFDSKYTDYDVMSTLYKRDILKELAHACMKNDLKLCFYYSIMDWHHPDYLPRRDWEKGRSSEGTDYIRYQSYMKNQLKELLSNYGKIGIIWFDGEWEDTWTHEQGLALYYHLRRLDKDLIINNRVDKGRAGMHGMTTSNEYAGDFGTPEQEIPATGIPGIDWESCITMNNNWGYNKKDQNWKSTEDLIHKLVDIVSKGGNFLLNVGPTAEGVFPDASIERLQAIGSWMKINSNSIYGTQASPFATLDWGRCTMKKSGSKTSLFFHIFQWPHNNKLIIPGLSKPISRIYALADEKKTELLSENKGSAVIVNLTNVKQQKHTTAIVFEFNEESVITQ